MKIENKDAYPASSSRMFTLTVTAHTDMYPGTWHGPEDLMRWIAQHSYVHSVEFNPLPVST